MHFRSGPKNKNASKERTTKMAKKFCEWPSFRYCFDIAGWKKAKTYNKFVLLIIRFPHSIG